MPPADGSSPSFNLLQFVGFKNSPPPAADVKTLRGTPLSELSRWLPSPDDARSQAHTNIPHRPDLTNQNALAQMPNQQWLNNVRCDLIYPKTNDQISEITAKIRELIDAAERTSSYKWVGWQDLDEPIIALDLESTGLDTRTIYVMQPDGTLQLDPKTKIVGICLSISPVHGLYLPVNHTTGDGIPNWSESAVRAAADLVLSTATVIFHNAQYDRELLALAGVTAFRPHPHFLDTQILHYLHDVNEKVHGLKVISTKWLARPYLDSGQLITYLTGEQKPLIMFDRLAACDAFVYGCADAMNTLAIFRHIWANIPPARNPFLTQSVAVRIDHLMADALRIAYRVGMPVDLEYNIHALFDATYRVNLLEQIIRLEANDPLFEVGSPKQVSELLFDKMKVPPLPDWEKSERGSYSVDEDNLDALAAQHPNLSILQNIVLYRKLDSSRTKIYAKAIANSYADDLNPQTRNQIQLNLTNVPTGRLSSSSGDGKLRLTNRSKTSNPKFELHNGSWDCGYNSQGVSNPPYKTAPTKRIKRLPGLTDRPHPHDGETTHEVLHVLAAL